MVKARTLCIFNKRKGREKRYNCSKIAIFDFRKMMELLLMASVFSVKLEEDHHVKVKVDEEI